MTVVSRSDELRERLSQVPLPTLTLPLVATCAGPVVTGERVREGFARQGLAVTEWARRHGFKASLVYSVLYGSCKAKRGKSHTIAVLLGMKHGVALAHRPAK